MDYIFIVTEHQHLTPEEIERLSWLSFKDGRLYDAFLNKKGTVILCKDITKELIIGWGFVYQHYNKPNFHVYISKSYRRLGLGKMIFKIATGIFGELMIFKWNHISTKFYDSVENN
jgi:hypothetical protein